MPTCAYLGGLLTSKVGQTEGSLVDLCMQDYKSLCAVVMICASLVNIQTDTQHNLSVTFPFECQSLDFFARGKNHFQNLT